MKSIMYFLKVSKKQWFYLSLGLLLSIITMLASLGLLSIAGYLICGAALAGVLGTAASFNYFLPAAGVRFFAMARIASRYGDRVLTHEATFRLLKDLRVWFYQKIEPLAPNVLLKHRSGDLLSRMISDINALDKLYLRLAIPFASAIILIIAVNIFIGIFSVRLSLTLLLIFLIAVLFIPKLTYQLGKKPATRSIKKTAQMRSSIIEFGNHLLELILYDKVNDHIQSSYLLNSELMQAQKKQANIRGLTNALILFLTSLSLVVVLMIGIPLVYQKQLEPANLGLLLLVIFAIFEAILVLPQACQYISETVFASNRLLEIARAKASVKFSEKDVVIPNYSLRFNSVEFSYTDDTPKIFDDFSLEIKSGEHAVILAETGRGKSTLAFLATRCFDPSNGVISLGGINLKCIPEIKLRDSICYISQDSHMFNNTLKDNLRIAKENASDSELQQVLQSVGLEEFSDDLETVMGEFGKQFSGGQIRRVALARAVLKNAPITILDEPFEGVDSATAEKVFQNLQTHFFEKTLLVITHQMKHIPDNVRRIQL